jgi:hypothetical protein
MSDAGFSRLRNALDDQRLTAKYLDFGPECTRLELDQTSHRKDEP